MKIKIYKHRAYLDNELNRYIDLDANEFKKSKDYLFEFENKKINCKILNIITKPAKYFILYPVNDFVKIEEEIDV